MCPTTFVKRALAFDRSQGLFALGASVPLLLHVGRPCATPDSSVGAKHAAGMRAVGNIEVSIIFGRCRWFSSARGFRPQVVCTACEPAAPKSAAIGVVLVPRWYCIVIVLVFLDLPLWRLCWLCIGTARVLHGYCSGVALIL